jgi:hypothetical protein
MTFSSFRSVATVVFVIFLFGCTPAPNLTAVSPSPSSALSPLPVPTPAPLGTTQTIRLKNLTLAITPTAVKNHFVSSTTGLGSERYIAIKFQIDSLGPGVWHPLDYGSTDNGGICLDLQVSADISRPSCSASSQSPLLLLTTGKSSCGPRFGYDPLYWRQEPEISLQPFSPGESRVGWLTWCIPGGFGANSPAMRDGFILETYGSIFGFWAKWSIYPFQ